MKSGILCTNRIWEVSRKAKGCRSRKTVDNVGCWDGVVAAILMRTRPSFGRDLVLST